MRILILSQYFWPENFRVNDLAESLLARGHEVHVLTAIPNYPKGKFFPGYSLIRRSPEPLPRSLTSVKIHRVPIIPRGKRKGIQLAFNYLSFILSSSMYVFKLQRYDACFIFASSPLLQAIAGVILKKKNGTPLIIWVQDLWPESLSAVNAVKSKLILNSVGVVVSWIYRNCDLVLVQSKGFISKVQEWGATPEKTRYFPNWAEDFYSTAGHGEVLHLPTGFKILFAGNLGLAQGLQAIIDAATLTKSEASLKWVIVGDGSEKSWMEKQVLERGLGDTVKFVGRKAPEEMPNYFSQADALLVTLRKDPIFELTIPSKIQSYLAAGKPILGALDGEGADLINSTGVGFAGPALNGETLAKNALLLYQTSPEKRGQMGESGKQVFANEFARSKLIAQLEGWMGEVAQ